MSLQAASTLAVVETNLRIWRSSWRGSAFSAFVAPVLYLTALGLGLGRLVQGGGALGGVDYVAFIAPGLLVANAMQSGAGESSWILRGRLTWRRTFHGMVATPVTVADLVAGHLVVVALRLAVAAAFFVIVAAVFGAVTPARAVLGVGPAVLTGVAIAAPVTAFSAWIERDEQIATLFRFGLIPMFVLAGTFFPVERLPLGLELLAQVTPLYHGVTLARSAMLGVDLPLPAWVHVGYLLLMLAVGCLLATRALRRKLHW